MHLLRGLMPSLQSGHDRHAAYDGQPPRVQTPTSGILVNDATL